MLSGSSDSYINSGTVCDLILHGHGHGWHWHVIRSLSVGSSSKTHNDTRHKY